MGQTNAAIESRNTYEYFPLHVNMKVIVCLVLLGVALVAARPQDVVAPAAESEVPAPVQPEVHAAVIEADIEAAVAEEATIDANIEAVIAEEATIEAAIAEEAANDADIVAAIEADIAAKAAIVDVPQVQEPVVEDGVQVLEPVVQAAAPVAVVQAAAPVEVVQAAAPVEEVQAAEPVVRASVQLVAVQEVEASVEDVRSFDNTGYSFLYAISDEDSQERDLHFGHKESRSDESDVPRGSYYVNLPDSRRLVVTYYVDEDGFHPTITYEGEAVHAESRHPNTQHSNDISSTILDGT